MKNLREIEKVDAFSSVMHSLYNCSLLSPYFYVVGNRYFSQFLSIKFAQVHSSTLISLYKNSWSKILGI